MLINFGNAITCLSMDRLGLNLGGRPIISPIWPSWCGCHGNGRCLATAHWTFSSYRHLEGERVNQFWWNLVHNSKLGPQWRTAAMLENIGNAITRLPMDRLGRNLGGLIPSRSWPVRHDAVAMASAVAYHQCIQHSAVMGVWRPNAWTNFDEIWYTTAN